MDHLSRMYTMLKRVEFLDKLNANTQNRIESGRKTQILSDIHRLKAAAHGAFGHEKKRLEEGIAQLHSDLDRIRGTARAVPQTVPAPRMSPIATPRAAPSTSPRATPRAATSTSQRAAPRATSRSPPRTGYLFGARPGGASSSSRGVMLPPGAGLFGT